MGGGVSSESRRAGNHAVSLKDIVEHDLQKLLPTPSVAVADGGQTSRSGDRSEPLLAGIAEGMQLLPSPVVRDSAEARNSTATRKPGSEHHGGDTLLDAMTHLGLADPGNLLPTPVVEPTAGNGHARDLGGEISMLPTPTASDGERGSTHEQDGKRGARMSSTELLFPTPSTSNRDGNTVNNRGEMLLPGVAESLLPTPSASQNGDDADVDAFLERKAADAAKWGTGGVGTPLGVAVRSEHDGTEDISADGEPVRWGKYRAAVLRAEIAAGRGAPSPTTPDGKKGKRRLAARFVEWMMLLPLGWVTGVPGIIRRDQLKMLGNGVVPAQASAATLILLDRVEARLKERRAA